jgi:hypothetical protein
LIRNGLVRAAALVLAVLVAGKASALTLPFTEDFAADAAGWTVDGASTVPATSEPTGGPDGSSWASVQRNYFGFTEPFPGAGPIVIRANAANDASDGAFVGDWTAGDVVQVSAWVYQETGVDLTFYLRLTTPAGFPGAVFLDPTPVPSGTWTQLTFEIAPTTPPCSSESAPMDPSTCPITLANVGNLQFATSAPAALTSQDQAFRIGVDQVTITPEPGASALGVCAFGALAWLSRRRA